MSTLETLQDILVHEYSLPRERLSPDAKLETLGMDSLSLLELMFKIEDGFHLKIPGDPPANLRTVQDVVEYIDGLIVDSPTPATGASATGASATGASATEACATGTDEKTEVDAGGAKM